MLSMNGALIIDKPPGLTSHDVVARVRKLIGERRVGHTGTLDPFATGVLVVLVGRATRLAQFLSGAEKEYEAVIRFGYATDTGDVTGSRVEIESHAEAQSAQSLRQQDIETAMASFRGEIEQVPPMFSAKKVGGRKLYELARRGEELERAAVAVTVSEFEAIARDSEFLKSNPDGSADLRVRVVCSAGTYIRTLAEDLGKQLGVAAHLTSLRRTRAGSFVIGGAVTLNALKELAATGAVAKILISPHEMVAHLPLVEVVSEADAQRVLNGIKLPIPPDIASGWSENQLVRISNTAAELLAVGLYDENSQSVHPRVVIKENNAGASPPS